MNLYNPKLIITVGLLCFGVALYDYLVHSPNIIYGWFEYLHWYGKTAVVGFCLCLAWLFVSTLIKNKTGY